MRIQLKNIGLFLLILLIGTVSFSSCVNETWDEHYSIDNSIVSDKNLMQIISSNPDLKKFTWALKMTGYDEILSTSQMFTVWAPVDSAMSNVLDTTVTFANDTLKQAYADNLAKEYVENHISKYSYSASGIQNEKIYLINKKVTSFKLEGLSYMFGDTRVVQANMISSNGLLHIVSQKLNFFDNLWELLSKDERLDSIKNYLYSFDQIVFDEENSTPGDVNEEGQTVYLDSVMINTNKMFKVLGELTVEDSIYTAIWPTNTAWVNSYAKIKEYYRYNATEQITIDTLQRNNTALALIQDLVYSNSMQLSPMDSITTISENVFLDPAYLYEGAELMEASNGKAYITDELKFKHYESWNKEIRVEAETTKGRESSYSNIYNRTYSGSEFSDSISKKKYIEVSATSTRINPTVTFVIPNTLSGKMTAENTIEYGASYNIYCVFVPGVIKTGSLLSAKPNKVYFELSYTGTSKKEVTDKYHKDEPVITSNEHMSKILVASNVSFPFCEFGLDDSTVELKVKSDVSSSETVAYTRDLLIDCIILEPVQ